MTDVQSIKVKTRQSKIKCPDCPKCEEDGCVGCEKTHFKSNQGLRQHIEEAHAVPCVIAFYNKKEFSDKEYQDFLKAEAAKLVTFTKRNSSISKDGMTNKITYDCNRTGYSQQFKRDRKEQQSGEVQVMQRYPKEATSKINGTCPMELIVVAPTDKNPDKKFIVTYHAIHFGHLIADASHCTIPEDHRKEYIVDKAKMGVPLKRIDHDINLLGSGYEVIKEKANKKLIQNTITEAEFSNREVFGKFHRNDYESCKLRFVQLNSSNCQPENRQPNDLPRLYYTNLGEEGIREMKDAIFILSSPLQVDLLKKYGKQSILMDTTFGLVKPEYNQHLTMVLVTNEFGVGMPVVYILAHSQTTETFTFCLKKLREVVGEDIKPVVFMSDDTTTFSTAWEHSMGKPENPLICAWHVRESWKKQLRRKGIIKGSQTWKRMVDRLETLIMCTSEKELMELIESIKVDWGSAEGATDANKAFLFYLETYYFTQKRLELWAAPYRTALVINTNNFVESNFKKLKYWDLGLNQNVRMDELINELIRREHDDVKKYNTMLKNNTGYQDENNRENHKKGGEILIDKFQKKNDKWWVIDGCDIILGECEQCQCLNRCSHCNACVQRFTCTCHVYTVKRSVCAHIHMVCIVDDEVRKILKKVAPRKPLVTKKLQIVNPPALSQERELEELFKTANEFYQTGQVIDTESTLKAMRTFVSKMKTINKIKSVGQPPATQQHKTQRSYSASKQKKK